MAMPLPPRQRIRNAMIILSKATEQHTELRPCFEDIESGLLDLGIFKATTKESCKITLSVSK